MVAKKILIEKLVLGKSRYPSNQTIYCEKSALRSGARDSLVVKKINTIKISKINGFLVLVSTYKNKLIPEIIAKAKKLSFPFF